MDNYDIANSSEPVQFWYHVAKNPNTPVDALVKLSTAEHWYVRLGIAENPQTPVDILKNLLTDEVSYVKNAARENPNTPIRVFNIVSF